MKMTSLFLALIFLGSMAQAEGSSKESANENGVLFMDYKCSLAESAKRLIFADADVDVLETGVMLNTKERVLAVRTTARTGTKQSSNLLLFLKRISKNGNKATYSFDTKLGAVVAIEEVSSNEGRTRTMKIAIKEESGTTEATVECSATLTDN